MGDIKYPADGHELVEGSAHAANPAFVPAPAAPEAAPEAVVVVEPDEDDEEA